MFQRVRFPAFRSTALAGMSIVALACVSVSTAYGHCRDREDQRTSPNSPYYPALKQAVDNYFAKRHQADCYSALSLHASFSATGSALDIASGAAWTPLISQ